MINPIIIPLQLDNYEDMFLTIDRRPLNRRKVNEEVDLFLKEILFNESLKEFPSIQIDLYLPKDKQDFEKERLLQEGLVNHYQSFTTFERKVRNMGIIRLASYTTSSLVLFILYYFVEKYFGSSFFSTILSTAATVILWQISSLIFIESKNFNVNIRLHHVLSHLTVYYHYDDKSTP
ncbi:MAG: hypothetical protein ACRCST_08380 [Turicibacter sp.]